MKKIFLVILAAVAVISASSLAVAADESSPIKVIAYYFHGSFRCPTCINMEKYSREAIDSNFKDALASGRIEFKAVNVEDRDNRHFIDDYQLYTKSLILSLVKDSKEVKSKNLDKIWEYVRNKQRFFEYVSEEANNFLKEAQ